MLIADAPCKSLAGLFSLPSFPFGVIFADPLGWETLQLLPQLLLQMLLKLLLQLWMLPPPPPLLPGARGRC